MKFAYSFLYADSSYPPDWYLDYMKEYIENAFPSYVMQYLPGSYLTVEPADYAYLPEVTPWDWRSYFERVRMQATWGQDAFFVISDVPYQQISGGSTAGEDYYLAHPNWGWVGIAGWRQVDYIARAYYNNDRFKAMQLGLPNNRGINSLATVGHEMTHAVLLKMYGISRSEEIDGGALSGIVYLDDALLPVSYSRMKYAMQRITDSLPYSANLGAYSMSRSSAGSALRCDICSSYLLR